MIDIFEYETTARRRLFFDLSGLKRRSFFAIKRSFDIFVSLGLLPILAIFSIILLALNPFYNRGPLLFVQRRMGRSCKPFTAIKFRSMVDAPQIKRSATCPLEVDRITPLGAVLRKSRIDELPQIINVLRGDMSLIGPRPDYYDHAIYYLDQVKGYRRRHSVRPGISGLAQTELGYVEGIEATKKKVCADLYYIMHTNLMMEAWIVWRTLSVIIRRSGA